MNWAGTGWATVPVAVTVAAAWSCVGLLIAQFAVKLTRKEFFKLNKEPRFRPALLDAMRLPLWWPTYWTWWGVAIANTIVPVLYFFTMPAAAAWVIVVGGAALNIPLASLRVWMLRFWQKHEMEMRTS